MLQRQAGRVKLVRQYTVLAPATNSTVEIRGWVEGVRELEPLAVQQLAKIASMREIVKRPVVAMPDLHLGNGVAVGAVIPTVKAIIPAAVGVDIGCGIVAVKTSLKRFELPDKLDDIRLAIEVAVPHGRTHNGQPENDAGGWRGRIPQHVANAWKRTYSDDFLCRGGAPQESALTLEEGFKRICAKYPQFEKSNHINHLGTLGTGNHFVEMSVDENSDVWFVVHSGSRGIGSRIGQSFIELAKKDMGSLLSTIPDQELAYVREGTVLFDDYVSALRWAQDFARINRLLMMRNVVDAVQQCKGVKPFQVGIMAINCHHNYVEKCTLLDANSHEWLTRKGATSAKTGELGIIPGSMGAKTFVVRGLGNAEAYHSCSHGAGRAMSRGEAVRRFSVSDHIKATQGICCRKDKDVIDETPAAYKDIQAVMNAQRDLVEVLHSLSQIVCVKG